jgi:hypothetical protein
MVIGGIAIIARGVRRMTTDIDAVVRGDRADVPTLLRLLAKKRIVARIDDSLRQLRRSFPADQRTRVAGKLDLLKHSSQIFSLIMSTGELRGVVVADADFAKLGQLLGQQVVVSGTAKFRPSGRVLRVEAEQIVAAEGDTTPWEASPRPLFSDLETRSLRVPQGPKSGVAALFGQWPGDETDDDFECAVRDLS